MAVITWTKEDLNGLTVDKLSTELQKYIDGWISTSVDGYTQIEYFLDAIRASHKKQLQEAFDEGHRQGCRDSY